MGMWVIFHRLFRRNLTEVLKYDEQESRNITAAAKRKYRGMIEKLPAALIVIVVISKKVILD